MKSYGSLHKLLDTALNFVADGDFFVYMIEKALTIKEVSNNIIAFGENGRNFIC